MTWGSRFSRGGGLGFRKQKNRKTEKQKNKDKFIIFLLQIEI
jgi:hypothetical protein